MISGTYGIRYGSEYTGPWVFFGTMLYLVGSSHIAHYLMYPLHYGICLWVTGSDQFAFDVVLIILHTMEILHEFRTLVRSDLRRFLVLCEPLLFYYVHDFDTAPFGPRGNLKPSCSRVDHGNTAQG